jgi:hypothetical protein
MLPFHNQVDEYAANEVICTAEPLSILTHIVKVSEEHVPSRVKFAWLIPKLSPPFVVITGAAGGVTSGEHVG